MEHVILAIESSCDETSVAIMKGEKLLSNVISSQIEIHRRFGGVVPEIASRNHLQAILPVINEALEKAQIDLSQVTSVAVTRGAGLIGALLVGVSAAKALAYSLNVPLYAVNHIQAHIAANYIAFPELAPPFLAIVASGGHTGIVKVASKNEFIPLALSTDDAIGEAFDKVARALGLPYPGGPEIDRRAKEGKPSVSFTSHKITGISYSGLKTAVVNYLHTLNQRGQEVNVCDVCASFQKTAVDMLMTAAASEIKKQNLPAVVLAGGVAANSYIRESLKNLEKKYKVNSYCPPLVLCTDNAAMVARRALDMIDGGLPSARLNLNAVSNLKISDCYE